MFVVKTIKLSKKYSNQNRIVLLFDTSTTLPCLYPLLYSTVVLRFQSFATQQSDLLALKFWYEFWYQKYSTSFCETFLSSQYEPEIFLNEIDNFIVFLENNKKLEVNLIRLRSNIDVNYMTITQRLRSLFKYFIYLLDEYWNVRYQDITIKELTNRRKKIDLFLLNKKRNFSKFSKRSTTVKSEINHSFKSLTQEMAVMLYKIIRPDQATNINLDNPFSTKSHQLRNFLIVHLMMNYGLRVGELMLLTKRSIKKSLNSDSYSLIITNTDDEHDSRQRKPSIKNEQSYRVIKLDCMDYKFLRLYIEKIRNFNDSDILFTSLKPPYSPLSYSSINAIFNIIEQTFRTLHPIYFDDINIDSIQKLTPHVCRHTWAYMTLAYAVKKYRNDSKYTLNQSNDEIMQKALEDLRVLGGWSANSIMPNYYAKRFIVDSANFINLQRISQELWE
ncbi:site-specific integrase [Acinetobacter nosocomialis]|uniref:site-specific integrase n=1 Tax=Acinetobacter nosocomialis TaxID=106654 RepID=UPI002292F9B8|nr:site-specific integrase [Acinetobacter nosocomialis]MDO7509527.1 site-specific integrase [Acinetobacter baumannii]MDO7192436.1 site-specific integrase [Acinetobacter nosocomialis]MDV7627619.1 site-specific integrase [Acinetobacter baumannii]MDV7648809.1 site-specific integrase [Acinetobacter baumannii]MDV7652978.1 site-specific integrase [Acinetobacter baumannii]